MRVSILTMINAVPGTAENGCKWRALPPLSGNRHMICTRLHRPAGTAVPDRLLAALQEHRLIRVRFECPGLDNSSVKVHPDGTRGAGE